MKETIFKSILVLMMCDDPSNLTKEENEELEEWADKEAKEFGYNDWIEAYHFKHPNSEKQRSNENIY